VGSLAVGDVTSSDGSDISDRSPISSRNADRHAAPKCRLWCAVLVYAAVDPALFLSSPRRRGPRLLLRQLTLRKSVDTGMKQPVVYILASEPYGTLYIGVTADLAARIEHDEMYEAIQREKRLKKRNRAWKIRLIEEMNPEWKDLSEQAF
jgi:putative endonuclease